MRLRLLAAEPAWATLMELLTNPDPWLRLRAARDILDRAGFAPGLNVTVERRPEDLSQLSSEELLDRATEVVGRLRQQAIAEGEVTEAEECEEQ